MQSYRNIHENRTGNASDKWDLYLDVYHNELHVFQDKKINLLEIGVQNGGSLEVWSKYFQKAKRIIGCDINEDCRKLSYSDKRIEVLIGDATNNDFCEKNFSSLSLDVIIDDGAHTSESVIKAFCLFFDRLKYGGKYIIEDLHCSYWQNYQGGLKYPYSSMSFLKKLADIVNHEHWNNNQESNALLTDYFKEYKVFIPEKQLTEIASVKFINSMCVIEKKSSEKNEIGKRNVTGTIAKIADTILNYRGSNIDKNNQVENPWSNFTENPDVEYFRLKKEKIDDQKRIDSLKHELTGKQQALLQAQNRENEQLKTIQKYEEQYMELKQKLQNKEQQIHAERKRLQQELKHTNNTLNRLMANERTKLVRQYHRRLPLRLAGNLWRFIKNPLQYYRMRRDTLVVRRSGLFDDAWYLQQYPDLYLTTVDMLQHYMLYGAAEGRNPNSMFDANYYLKENPDVKNAGINPLLHYALYGWIEKRNPSLNFDTKYYLQNNPDVKNAKVNPLAHYLKFGLLEKRDPKDVNEKGLNNQENDNINERSSGLESIDRLLSDSEYQQICNKIINCKEDSLSIEFIAKRTGLFNEKYYSNFVNNSEIKDLFNHYINKGYLIGLNPSNIFNTKQYYEANVDVYWANMNPLEHFIKYGYLENRKFFCSDIIDPKFKRFFGRSEYGMTGQILAYDKEVRLDENFNLSIGVHLHLYYIDLAEELLIALSNIPYTFSLFISTPHGEKELNIIKEIIHKKLPLCAKYKIVQFENRGRDIAPFIVEFGNELLNFDLILHYHSKKSLHSDGLADARRFLLHYILGNKSIVCQTLNLLYSDNNIGIVCPPYHSTLHNQPNFGKNKELLTQLMSKLNIPFDTEKCTNYPAGSFFWARSESIKPIFQQKICLSDFQVEKGQIDGTLSHVIERALGIIANHKYKVVMPYIDIPYNLVNYYSATRNYLIEKKVDNLTDNQIKFKKTKIAYVTAIFGDFDNLLIPEHIEPNVDYYCFTDNPTLTNEIFKTITVGDYYNEDKRMLARYVKTNTLRLLPDYDYIIWIDANIYFKGLVNDFINELDKNKMLVGGISHNVRKDCFSEALECVDMQLDSKEKIEKQILKYLALPNEKLDALKKSRLIETNFMILKNSKETVEFQKIWWDEIERHSKRDQVSVNYSLLMANLNYYPLLNEKKTVRDDHRFAMFAHKKIKNENSFKKEVLSISYRSHDDLLNSIRKHLLTGKFDNFNLIVGIPRSGMIPAHHLGQLLNLPVLSYDEFISEIDPIKGDRRLREQDASTSDKLRVLFIDDSINNGNAYNRFINNLPKEFKGKNFSWDYLAVYGSENANKSLFIEFCPTPRIFQWNYKNHPLSRYFCYDLDGVLCVDPTDEQNDDGEKYIEFIKNAKPLYIPNYHIKAIVTSRLEKYRSFTEKWLADNNVRYGHLYMLNLPSKEERIRLNAHSSFKAEMYSQIKDSILFIESNNKQAKEIAEKTGKKVICTENDIIYP